MNAIKFAIASVAFAGALGAASAEARGRDDVQFSVTIGNPRPALLVAQPVQYHPAPLLVRDEHRGYRHSYPQHYHRHAQPTRWDRDGDGVPNRFDRVYNPRWDRDGDGIPNRYDRRNDLRGRR